MAEETFENSSVNKYRESTMGMTFVVPSEGLYIDNEFTRGKNEERKNKINSLSTQKRWTESRYFIRRPVI